MDDGEAYVVPPNPALPFIEYATRELSLQAHRRIRSHEFWLCAPALLHDVNVCLSPFASVLFATNVCVDPGAQVNVAGAVYSTLSTLIDAPAGSTLSKQKLAQDP